MPRVFFTVFWLNAYDSPGGWVMIDVAMMDNPEVDISLGPALLTCLPR